MSREHQQVIFVKVKSMNLSNLFLAGTVVTTNGLIVLSALVGPVCTNGAGTIWFSNGVAFLRTSTPGSVTSTDKPL